MLKSSYLERRLENLDLQSYERTIFLFPLVLALGFVFLYLFLPIWYLWLVKEDKIVEYLQAASFLLASAISFIALTKLRKSHHKYIVLLLLMFACGTLFIFFEEISWGQRIIGIKSTEFFKAHNLQKEITLHNFKPVCSITSIIKMVVGLYGGLAWIFTRNVNWKGADWPIFIIPEWYCSLYFLPIFFYDFYHKYIFERPNMGSLIWPHVGTWKLQEPCELLLAFGFLLVAVSNYKKAIDLIKTF